MFTGIIKALGTVVEVHRQGVNAQLVVKAPELAQTAQLGDSIAVNGVCLTVTRTTAEDFAVDVMAETLRRTTIGSLQAGAQVNLEPALAVCERFGGHIVSGHIDDTGQVIGITPEGTALRIRISTSLQVQRLIIPQGSIAVDGISLTVAATAPDHSWFEVSIIPHTQKVTNLGAIRLGEQVNLENDVVGKYVQALTLPYQTGGITEQLLQENGFWEAATHA